MSVTVTLVYATIAEAAASLARLDPGAAHVTVTPLAGSTAVVLEESSKLKGQKAKGAATPAAQPQAEAGNAGQSAGAADAQASAQQNAAAATTPATAGATTLSYDGNVKPAILALAKAKGSPIVAATLAEFGVDHGTKLQPDQWQPFIDRATALMA